MACGSCAAEDLFAVRSISKAGLFTKIEVILTAEVRFWRMEGSGSEGSPCAAKREAANRHRRKAAWYFTIS